GEVLSARRACSSNAASLGALSGTAGDFALVESDAADGDAAVLVAGSITGRGATGAGGCVNTALALGAVAFGAGVGASGAVCEEWRSASPAPTSAASAPATTPSLTKPDAPDAEADAWGALGASKVGPSCAARRAICSSEGRSRAADANNSPSGERGAASASRCGSSGSFMAQRPFPR